MPTLEELENTPGFEKLSYRDQTLLRGEFFQRTVGQMPEFKNLTPETQQSFFSKATDRAPILEAKDSDFFADASHTVEGMKTGDLNAVSDAIGLSSVRNATKQMLIPTLAAKGVDAFADLLDPEKTDDRVFADYYGKDGTKVDQWLQKNIEQYGGEKAVKDLESKTFKLGAIGGLAEFALMTLALHGVGSAIGGAVKGAAIAGPGIAAEGAARGASIARGILTGEHLNAATQAALATTKLSSPLLKTLAGLTVEGVQSGVVQTGLDMLRLGLQDEFENKTNKQVWDTIGVNFGMNVAMNYIGWGAVKAFGTVAKGSLKAAKGITLDAVEHYKQAFRIETNPVTKALGKDYAMNVVAAKEALQRMAEIDPKNTAGLKVIAQSAGWDMEFNADGSVRKMWNIGQPSVQFENLTAREGRRRVAELYATGMPSDIPTAKTLDSLRGEAAMADNRTTLLRKTTLNLADQIPPEQIQKLLLPQDGLVNKDNIEFFGKQYLKSRGVPAELADQFNVQLFGGGKVKPLSTGMTSVVNRQVKSLTGEQIYLKSFIDDLDRIVKESGGEVTTPFTFKPPVLDVSQTSLTALKATADELGIPITFKNMTAYIDGQEFRSMRDASGALLAAARRQGKLSIEQLDSIMSQKFGLKIKEVERPVMSKKGQGARLASRLGGEAELKYKSYEVSKPVPGGIKQVASAPDLETLFKEHPDLDPGMPSTFAPKTWIVDPKAKTLTIENTIVTGEGSKLIELSGKFTSPINPKVIDIKGKEKLLADASRISYLVRNDELGVWAEYDTIQKARNGLKSAVGETEKRQLAFAMRDMKVRYAPDGTIIAVAADGSGKRFTTALEAEKWLKETPLPNWINELLPVDPQLANEAAKQVGNVSDQLYKLIPDHKIFTVSKPSKMVRGTSRYLLPTEMALSIAKRNHNQPDLLNYFREMGAGLRIVQGFDNKSDAIIQSIFKKTSYDQRVMYHVLVGNDPSKWDEIALKSFKHTLTEADKATMQKMTEFYESAFSAVGVPDWKRVSHYAARVRDYAEANQDDILDAMTASEYLQKSLGHMPQGFAFFGEHSRASDVLKLAMIEDGEQAMRAYAYSLNKHNYLDPLIKKLRTGLQTLDGKFPKEELDFFRGALNELQAESVSPNYAQFREGSKKVVVAIQQMMQKVPGLRDSNMANAAMVGDVIDLFNSQMTVATQSKPWAVFRNMFQINLLGAALGNNGVMWRAFKEVIDESDDATVKMITKTGAIRGGGFVGSNPNSRLGVWRKLMKWNENMDIMTRASAFKATGHLLDEAWPLFKNGTLDSTKFLKRSGLSVLDSSQRGVVLEALNRGDMAFAKDYYGDALNRLVFFDYSKMNRAFFQRGVMGKIFGKFGTYPSGTLALYQRLLSNGTLGERIGRMGRIVLNATMIYEGMKMMGVDYRGFKWTDPFSFQGGPLWHLLADGSQFIGDDSQAKQARASVVRNLPRLMSPSVNTMYQIERAMKYLDDGDIYSAGIALSGAPARRDLNWTTRPRF